MHETPHRAKALITDTHLSDFDGVNGLLLTTTALSSCLVADSASRLMSCGSGRPSRSDTCTVSLGRAWLRAADEASDTTTGRWN